ncbi:SDR family oxidoreductase [Mucilaginibacter koreensis]
MNQYKPQFSGLWAVILGGSSGFGLATVKKLAAHGMNIAVLYREPAAITRKLKAEFEALATEHQVTILHYNSNALDAAARNSFLTDFISAVDNQPVVRLLLHAVARGNLKPLAAEQPGAGDAYHLLSVDDIQHTSYAMANSLLDWARLLLDAGLFYKDARIIGLTSEGAHRYWNSYAAVSVAKASLESLATYMAVDLARFGLKTNIIQAGVTPTPSLKRIAGSEQLLDMIPERNPMGRATQPEDVANAIYLLCMDEAFWINGSIIHVDGGEHCR